MQRLADPDELIDGRQTVDEFLPSASPSVREEVRARAVEARGQLTDGEEIVQARTLWTVALQVDFC